MKKFHTIVILLIAISLAACQAQQSIPNPPDTRTAPESSNQNPRLPSRLDYQDLARLLSQPDNNVLLLDVRTLEEFNQGYIAGAVLAPYDQLEASFKEMNKDRPIVLYCRSGNRSSIAKRSLEKMGYTNVSDFGGINRWMGSLSRP